MAAGDVAMTVALADSLFFDIGPEAARGRVLLFLLISIAPFAIVAPLIGPAIDRMPGGRRLVVQIVAGLRVIVLFGMIVSLDSLALFPLAFASLVLQKTYAVSRAALVPSAVRNEDELVEANAKLGLISGIVGTATAIPAALLSLIDARASLALGMVLFAMALWYATRLNREVVAAQRETRLEQEELHSVPIVLAASAMGLLRASVGFMFFHLAFWLRTVGGSRVTKTTVPGGDEVLTYSFGVGVTGTLWFGVAVAVAALATMVGNAAAPMLRRSTREETMLVGSLAFVAVAGVVTALLGGVAGAVLLAASVNLSAAVGRLAFDSIVQRSAPDANQGRAFARFETRFQLAWVLAGVIPVLLRLPASLGFAVVGGIAAFAAITYLVSMRRLRRGQPLPLSLRERAARPLRRRIPRVKT
ncbi:MAG: hypothetical protein WAS51_06945 [Ilumatobacteraceae bacterium]|nr:MAG: hypothetical protein IPM43_05875 [Actinomycetota bacterium]